MAATVDKPRNEADGDERHANAREEDAGGESDTPNKSVNESSSNNSNVNVNTLRIVESDVLRTRRKFSHTSEAQRLSVLEWLEQPPNFQLLAGGRDVQGGQGESSSSPRVPVVNAEGKKLKKTDGFRSLMRHVNARTQSQWSLDVTRSRFESLLAAFRKTRAIAARLDFHVTANDRVRGITTTRQKLNALCMCYDRLDALFTTGKPLKSPAVAAKPVPNGATMASETTAGVTEKNGDRANQDNGAKAEATMHDESGSRDEQTKKGNKASGGVQSTSQGGGFAAAAKAEAAVTGSAGKGKNAGGGEAGGSDDTQLDQVLEEKDVDVNAAHDDSKGDTVGPESVESAVVVVVAESTISSPSPSAKRLKRHHQSTDAASESSTPMKSPAATSEEEYQFAPLVPPATAPVTPSAVQPTATTTARSHEDAVKLKALEVESQKLALQQEQLQLQKRELALKEKELVAQESMKKQSVRADLTTKLVVAGKSLSEIKEFLALLDSAAVLHQQRDLAQCWQWMNGLHDSNGFGLTHFTLSTWQLSLGRGCTQRSAAGDSGDSVNATGNTEDTWSRDDDSADPSLFPHQPSKKRAKYQHSAHNCTLLPDAEGSRANSEAAAIAVAGAALEPDPDPDPESLSSDENSGNEDDDNGEEQVVLSPSMSNDTKLKLLILEKQKLALQQEQLELQNRELELREKELFMHKDVERQKRKKDVARRAEFAMKLAVVLHSLQETKDYLTAEQGHPDEN